MRIFKEETGITLVEIVIGLAIMSMSMLAAALSYVSLSRLQQKTATIQQVQQNGRYVMEAVTRDIRNSAVVSNVTESSISMASSLDKGTIIQYNYSSDEATLYRRVCPPGVTCDSSKDVSISGDEIRVTDVYFERKEPQKPGYIFVSFQFEQQTAGLLENDPYFQKYDLNTIVSLRE